MERIVKLTFAPEHANAFEGIFQNVKERIKANEGCLSLKLLRDRSDPRIFMTYSIWRSPEFLQQYRRSDMFKELWTEIRPMFEEEPQAWSLDVLDDL